MKKFKLCVVILGFISFAYTMENTKKVINKQELTANYEKKRKRKRPVLDQANINNKRQKTNRKKVLHNCDYCNYTSNRKANLILHISRVHFKERPYKCDQCGHASACQSDLKRHTRIHTGETPYKCDQCYYASRWSTSLKNHKKIHISEKIETSVDIAPTLLDDKLTVLVEKNNSKNNSNVVEISLDNDKIGYNFQDEKGNTILMDASMSGNIELVTAILPIEAIDPNIQNNEGDTALILAVKAGHANVVKVLLDDQRINISITNNNGDTAQSIAEKSGYKEIARLIYAISEADKNIQTVKKLELLLKALDCAKY